MDENLFSGLEQLGLGDMSEVDIFDEKKEEEKQQEELKKENNPEEKEIELLFDKTFSCPLCNKKFTSKAVRAGKNQLIGSDSDLRAKYSIVDPIKYESIVCGNCGYAALNRFFGKQTPKELEDIKASISSKFKGVDETVRIYSYEEAFVRYQLALANAVIRKARDSEKGYICLKTAWILRGKAENLPTDMENIEEARKELKKQELSFIKNAYKGLSTALLKESMPICGMDEFTVMYLVADLARQCKDYQVSLKLVSELITSKTVSTKLKDRARDLKDLIKKERETQKPAQ